MHAIVNIAISAVRSASKIVMRSMDRLETGRIGTKNRHAFAAEVELTATNEISAMIQKAYPEHKMLTRANADATFDAEEYVWIISSIAGLTNYIHGLPHFATSIAVRYKNKLQHAVIYDPMQQDLYTASRGTGAFLNEHRIRVSQQKYLDGALLSTANSDLQTQALLRAKTDGILCSGSTALDLAYVAAARLEGFWGLNLTELDVAAGVLLVIESGGLVADFNGEEKYLENGTVIAGNPKIFKATLQTVKSNLAEL